MKITGIRHAWYEKAGFTIVRSQGYPEYTFLHFFESVELLVNGQKIFTSPHACILYAPGTPQYFRAQAPLCHDWFHFTGDMPAGILCPDTVYYPSDPAFITAAVQEMETEFLTHKPFAERLLNLETEQLFIRLARSSDRKSGRPMSAEMEKQIRGLRAAVFSDLSRNWTVAQMAEYVHLSQSRFFTLYKSLYGVSPVHDMIIARMDAAKEALTFSDRPITEIAEQLGYRNLSHFMRQFHAAVGQTPTEYRKRHSSL